MAATSVDILVESFKKTTISLIDGKPTYATIHAMHEILNSNAASINTKLGCGMLGHLCLTFSPSVYTNLSATWVVPHPNP